MPNQAPGHCESMVLVTGAYLGLVQYKSESQNESQQSIPRASWVTAHNQLQWFGIRQFVHSLSNKYMSTVSRLVVVKQTSCSDHWIYIWTPPLASCSQTHERQCIRSLFSIQIMCFYSFVRVTLWLFLALYPKILGYVTGTYDLSFIKFI